MKSKKLDKKLNVKKLTIVNLNIEELNQVKGGGETTPLTVCLTLVRTCSVYVC